MPSKAKLTTRSLSTTSVSTDTIPKNASLTNSELDSNFLNLRDQTIAISDGSNSTDIEAGETITFSGATVSGNTVTISPTGSGLSNVVEDTTPQLGGNLDINGFNIVSDSEDIKIIPGPTGKIQLDNTVWPADDGTEGQFLRTNGAGVGGTSDGTTTGQAEWAWPTGWMEFERASANITNITSIGDIVIKDTILQIQDGTSGEGLTFNDSGLTDGGTANNYWTGISGNKMVISSDDLKIISGSADLEININGMLNITNQTTANTATAGSQTLPSNPAGFLSFKINGTEYRLPYYNT